MPHRFSAIRILLLVGAATAVFYAGLFAGRPLLSALVVRMPENYEYLARRHAADGAHGRAIDAVHREIGRHPYNFHARFLEAEILRDANRHNASLQTLWDISSQYAVIVGRDVDTRGWNEPRLHFESANLLWDMKRYEEALDEFQAALDGSDPKVDKQCNAFLERIAKTTDSIAMHWAYIAGIMHGPGYNLDDVLKHPLSRSTTAPLHFFSRLGQIALFRKDVTNARTFLARELARHPNHVPALIDHIYFSQKFAPPATWANPLPLPRAKERLTTQSEGTVAFTLDPADKANLTNRTMIIFYRNAAVEGSITTQRATRGICLVASGIQCDDVWPIIAVRVNGNTIGKRYIHSVEPLAFSLPVDLPPGTHGIDLVFENDARNDVTELDRNAEVQAVYVF